MMFFSTHDYIVRKTHRCFSKIRQLVITCQPNRHGECHIGATRLDQRLYTFAMVLGVLFAALVGAFNPASAQQGSTVEATVVVHKSFPPLYLTTNGKPDGLAIDFIEAVAEIGGIKIRYLTVNTWNAGFQAIKSGKADIFPNVGISDKRRSFLDFSIPYDVLYISLFVRKNVTDINNLKDLNGRPLGIQDTNVLTKMFEKDPAIKLIKFNTYQEALLALLSGTVDAVPAPINSFWKIARKAQLDSRIKTVGDPLREVKRGVAVRKGNTALMERINKAIKEIKLSSEFRTMLIKWYGEPSPFWTVNRLLLVIGSLLTFIFFSILIWKIFYVRSDNIKLIKTKNELLRTKNKAEKNKIVAEQALSDLQDQKFILDYHSIVAVTDPSGKIIYANNKFSEISKYSKDELLGKNHKILNSGYHSPEFFRDLWDTISSGHIWSGEIKNKAKDGSYFWVSTSIAPMKNEQGQIIKYITARTDITERKHTEDRLRQSQKMDAIGQLSGGIAHDFNNILGIVQGNLELLQRIVADNPKALGRVEMALRGIARGARLTRKLLGFSHNNPQDILLTSVNTLIRGMHDLITKSLTVLIQVETRLGDDIWPVMIDPGDLEDSIINLALNARDAMPDGGTLIIETANKTFNQEFVNHNSGYLVGDYMALSISDTGTGMTREVREKAFEPFFSTKQEGQGTGLGLSMFYGFVQRSGGFINLYSEPGKGTTFRVYLPRSLENADDVKIVENPQPELPHGNETILIVDDEDALVDIATSYLGDLGYRVITANSGHQAIKILQDRKDIDLLFSDVVMPGDMDGYQLAIKALQNQPSLKVLMTSGFTKKRNHMVSGDAPIAEKLARSLLNKPYTKAELAVAIRMKIDAED